jgi:hypothetical protein
MAALMETTVYNGHVTHMVASMSGFLRRGLKGLRGVARSAIILAKGGAPCGD